jgi:hypothetical protein
MAMALDRHQVFQAEMQPNPEHQQNNPHLGQFLRQICWSATKSRREGADDDSRHQIPRDHRQLEPMRQKPQREGKAQADHHGRDKGGIVRHQHSFCGWGRA